MNILDTVCEDKALFEAAITHPSYTQEKNYYCGTGEFVLHHILAS